MKISIIGFGWLGKPLAHHLISKGHQVMGSATSEEKVNLLQREGLDTVLLKLCPHPEGLGFQKLFDADVLLINVPPRTRSAAPSFHPEQVKFIKAMIERGTVRKVIYVSATSVYPDLNQVAREEDPLTKSSTGNQALFDAESLLQNDATYALTIVRFGGLLGVDRIPGRYFSGKDNVVGDTPVNYIHRDDAVSMLTWIITKELWGEVFNGVAPLHPMRSQVYEKNAKDLGFAPPQSYAEPGQNAWKEISANKITKTGFEFSIPDPLDFWYEG
ncbi:NAD(P)-binding domain-containing protein [Belliella kenyensis]|uniref:NAD(P)-binding domain-containing protein n=1 Tax=Belliella kenyensis TaxID=1472724 RepID=A0ABV8EPV8_9BACT|nr:NAD(P)-binding domain-containing protein [Belliella kenyensis]MCH7402853.1 NAD(P)-binding domain-containing protein [Belliella kenyensis]MDN3602559.1 NAD(P)-binding domain-containing protein [Belliella kenyensis]